MLRLIIVVVFCMACHGQPVQKFEPDWNRVSTLIDKADNPTTQTGLIARR